MLDPVSRDVDPSAKPNIGFGLNMIEEAFKPDGAAGVAGELQVDAHRHHLWQHCALAIQQVEMVPQEQEKVIAGLGGATHVFPIVGREAVRHHEVRAAVDGSQ